MFTAAMLDCGMPFGLLKSELEKLHLNNYALTAEKTLKKGVSGTYFKVRTEEDHHHRNLSIINEIIENSGLSDKVKEHSLSMFRKLAETEAKVHGTDIENIHFHEVGAVDSIIDIVSAAIAVEWLQPGSIICSPLSPGNGEIKCEHGIFPVPAPATALLLKNKPVLPSDIKGELITPTGALIIDHFTDGFSSSVPFRYNTVGYGHGTREYDGRPNSLRLFIGEESRNHSERILIAEFNVDDTNPQDLGYLMEKLFDNKALDVFFTPVYMKKNRPGTLVSFMCGEPELGALTEIALAETTTLGIRYRIEERIFLERSVRQVQTPFGPVNVKDSFTGEVLRSSVPEYEDCAKIAKEKNLPLRKVRQIISGCLKEKE